MKKLFLILFAAVSLASCGDSSTTGSANFDDLYIVNNGDTTYFSLNLYLDSSKKACATVKSGAFSITHCQQIK